MDHCGALPWFLEKTAFKGRCFMTHASKAIYRWLLADYVKVRYVIKQVFFLEGTTQMRFVLTLLKQHVNAFNVGVHIDACQLILRCLMNKVASCDYSWPNHD